MPRLFNSLSTLTENQGEGERGRESGRETERYRERETETDRERETEIDRE